MLGVELVTDRQLKTPAKDEICLAMEHMKGKLPSSRIGRSLTSKSNGIIYQMPAE